MENPSREIQQMQLNMFLLSQSFRLCFFQDFFFFSSFSIFFFCSSLANIWLISECVYLDCWICSHGELTTEQLDSFLSFFFFFGVWMFGLWLYLQIALIFFLVVILYFVCLLFLIFLFPPILCFLLQHKPNKMISHSWCILFILYSVFFFLWQNAWKLKFSEKYLLKIRL